MAAEIVIWQIPGHLRSRAVCTAMLQGLANAGERVRIASSSSYFRPEGDVAIFYGLAGRLTDAIRDYPAAGKTAVYVDLGYWGRKDGADRFSGYHKLSINGRHPTGYFQRLRHDDIRAARLGLRVEPWRGEGSHILLAGMGPKGAPAEGFKVLEWETETVRLLRRYTDRPIVYRAKPNWPESPPVPHTVSAPRGQPLAEALARCHAVVTHHSNTAVEALQMGVPAFVVEGAALPMSLSDMTRIDHPARPAGRQQWINDLAYTQFSIAEMASGAAWRHLKSEGLVP